MSRYAAMNTEGERFEYGYDHPLQEYFIQKVTPTEEGFPVCVELVGNLGNVYGSAANLLEVVESHNIQIPEDHKYLILCDLPF